MATVKKSNGAAAAAKGKGKERKPHVRVEVDPETIRNLLEQNLTGKQLKAQDDVEMLLKHVVRAFYPDIYSVVMEALLEHKYLKDSDRVLRPDEEEEVKKVLVWMTNREERRVAMRKELLDSGLKATDDVMGLVDLEDDEEEEETIANVKNQSARFLSVSARQMRRYLSQLLNDGLVQKFEGSDRSAALPRRRFACQPPPRSKSCQSSHAHASGNCKRKDGSGCVACDAKALRL